MSERLESKLQKRQQRADAQIEKLNQVVSQQLNEIHSYKGVVADKERNITDLEKQVLLQGPSGSKSTYTGKETRWNSSSSLTDAAENTRLAVLGN